MEMWKYFQGVSKINDKDKKEDKTLKLVSNPIRRRLVNEPEQEISTRNGKLGVIKRY